MRIRTIKPEFWQNELLSELPESTHMLAAALLNYADDEGYFNANPGLIKGALCPLREPAVSIQESLKSLEKIGYLRITRGADNRAYGWIVKFGDHQTINRPSPSKIRPLVAGLRGEADDQAPLSEDSHQEQGTGNREQGNNTTAPAEPSDKDDAKAKAAEEFEAQFRLFKAAFPKRGGSQPWHKARRAINARLREGHAWEEIIEGARRYARFCKRTGKIYSEHVLQAATFCGPDKRFTEPFEVPAHISRSERTATAESEDFGGEL